MKKLSFLIVLIIALFTFTSCKDKEKELTPEERLNTILTDINTNLSDCTSVVYNSSIKAGEVLVNDSTKNVLIYKQSDGLLSLTITTTNHTLGSDFTLQEQVLNDFIDGEAPEDLFGYKFTYDAFSSIEITDSSIVGVVKSAEVSNVLNTSVNNSSDLNVTINFVDNKITGFSFSYTSTNNFSISISATYNY